MKIYELLDSPEKWTQYCSARNKDGNHVCIMSNDAVRWCLLGALQRCYFVENYAETFDKIKNHTGINISGWNDSPNRTFDEVRALALELDI